MKKINIGFTKGQFLEMMRLVGLGESVLNGHKLHEDFDKKAEAFQNYIVEQAVKNNIKDYLYYFPGSKELGTKGGYDISNDKSMDFFKLLEESHKNHFSEEIVEIVSQSEVFSKYGDSELTNMKIKEQEKIFAEMVDKVDNEFVKNGYENLKINWHNNKNPLFLK